jgi:CRP-like cAMP-binding protein
VYTKIYTATFTEKALLKLSSIPLLGRLFYNFLIERVYLRYDLLLMMTITISELLESKQFLRQEFENWQVIVKELQSELNNFEMSQTALLQTHPLLVKAVQTKNVGKTILNFGYQSLGKLHSSGEIDDIEKAALMKHLTRVDSKLRFVEKFIHKFATPKKKKSSKKENENLETVQTEDFKREISLIFPHLKELKRPDLLEFQKVLLHEKHESYDDEIICQSSKNSFGVENREQSYIYFIRSGMYKVRSNTDRVIRHLSRSDTFGAAQLISEDICVFASPMSHCECYKIPVEFVESLMNKYPLFQRYMYINATYNYLKCCPYILARTKTKYFRRLRRISYFHLKKIFENGLILEFKSTEEFMNYVFDNHFSALGLFVLKGGIKVQHKNKLVEKTRRLFKIDQISSIKEFLEDRDKKPEMKEKRRKSVIGKLDKNLFSVRNIMNKGKEEIQEIETLEIKQGNALEIQSHYLEKLEIVGDGLIVFLLETKTGGFEDKDHIYNKKNFKVNKINRRKYL